MSSDGLALPPRENETDDERRLREALNRHAEGFMRSLDAAISLRTAPAHVQRTRHVAKNDLQSALLRAMHAMDLGRAISTQAEKP